VSPQKLNLCRQLIRGRKASQRCRPAVFAQADRGRRQEVPGVGIANAENNHDLDVDD